MSKIKKWCAVLLCAALLFSFTLPISASAAQTTARRIVIQNGMAQPTLTVSNVRNNGYSNNNSDILRFIVYVETDYDTDMDGKPDLLRTYVQLPRPAAEKYYLAPVIFEARPYSGGKRHGAFSPDTTNTLTDADISKKPAKRATKGTIDWFAQASRMNPADWTYTFPQDGAQTKYPMHVDTYDYFLARGFAVVQTAGLGTYGSEGIECCGTIMEAEAFKCVIEWLNGKRHAFVSLTDNTAVDAGWSSGRVCMTGVSYAGATAYEVACTGVEGLETIVPVAGPSSWYDYSCSQGAVHIAWQYYNYTGGLMQTCASNLFTNYDVTRRAVFEKYCGYVYNELNSLENDYGDFWAARDFSNYGSIKASALIVQGLNDNNVYTKHFDFMRNAFLRSGCEVKSVLHQAGHIALPNTSAKYDIMVGDTAFFDLMNRWVTHYLLGVSNGVQKIPSLTVQNNLNGEFFGTDAWNTDISSSIYPSDLEQHTVKAEGAYMKTETLREKTLTGKSSDNALMWRRELTKPLTLNGTTEVHVRAKTYDTDKDALNMSAVLVDRADSEFSVYSPPSGTTNLATEVVQASALNIGNGLQPFHISRFVQQKAKSKVIATGVVDLRNPQAGYEPSTAVKPARSIKKGEWNDYTIYLNPNYYTVAAGHHLELYIVPLCDLDSDDSVYESRLKAGASTAGVIPINRNYSFTVDNSASYADLHTVEPRYLLMGDANRDGIITIGDGSMIQKAAIGLVDMSDMSYKIGDVNGDGKITVSDTTCIQRYLTSYKTGFGITGQDYKN